MTKPNRMTVIEMDARSLMYLADRVAAEDDGQQAAADTWDSLAASWTQAAALTRIADALDAPCPAARVCMPAGCGKRL